MQATPRTAPWTHLAILGWTLLAMVVGSCGESPVGEEFARYRALEATRRVDLFAPEGAALARAGELATRTLASSSSVSAIGTIQGRPLDIQCFPLAVTGDPCGGGRPGAARILVAPFAHPGLGPWLEGLDIEREATGFRHRGLRFGDERDALVVTRVDPDRAPLPATLVLAVDPSLALLDLGDLTPAWKLGYRAVLGGRTVGWGLDGREEAGAPRQPARPATPRVAGFGAEVRGDEADGGLRFLVDFDGGRDAWFEEALPRWRSELLDGGWVAAMEGVRDRLGTLIGREPEALPAVRVWLHGGAESMERHCGATGPVVYEAGLRYQGNEARGIVHVLGGAAVPITFEETYGLALARALVSEGGAGAVTPWLVEGLGVAAGGRWWGRDLDAWCDHLVLAGLDADPQEFLGVACTLSPHRRAPLRGAWVRGLAAMPRSAELMEGLLEGRDLASFSRDLEREFRGTLHGRATAPGSEAEWNSGRVARRTRISSHGFRRGVHLVAAGEFEPGSMGPSRGYGSARIEDSLEDVQGLGADAVGLGVTAWVEGGYPRYFGSRPREAFPGGPRANALDRELLRTCGLAQERGMAPWLSVDLLTNGSSSWSSWRQMPESLDEGWGATFDDLETTLIHYGLLAELCGVETLSLGSGLSNLTHVTIDEDWPADTPMAELKAARWPTMIERVRGGFSGALTYRAGGQSEVQGVSFWGDLDFTSFGARTPWVGADGWTTLGDAALVGRWKHWIEGADEVARIDGKRAVLLGVEAPSTVGGLREPSSVGGRVDLAAQARVFRALATALEDPEVRGRLAGVFVGRVSTESGRGGPGDPGYALLGKPAAEVVAEMFRR